METSLKELLMLMRHIYNASLNAKWEIVEKLDHQRRDMLDNLKNLNVNSAGRDKKTILELLELDQAVLALLQQELDFVASQVSTTHTQSRVCELYRANSIVR